VSSLLLRREIFNEWEFARLRPGDVTPPGTITVTGITATKISRVVGKDSLNLTVTADEAFVEYQIRRVSSSADPVTSGSLLEQATISSTTSYSMNITDDELIAAAAVEGSNTLKVFVKDAAGNWSV
jgi:hypothetical protein